MKILITGIAGFIGSHFAERLIDLGHEVSGIDNFSNYYSIDLKNLNAKILIEKGVVIYKFDLRNSDYLKKIPSNFDYIFHFAAQPGISKSSTFDDYFSNNVIGTQNLLEFALKNKNLIQFVNIATSSIYGLEATFEESKVPLPASNYGVSKLAAEQLALSLSRNNKLNACSLRLYSVYGPRERPDKLYTKLIDCAINKKPFPLFEGSQTHLRSFTYIDDIVDGIVSVIGKEKITNGEVFNLGTTVEHTTKEGIEVVEKALNLKIEMQILSARSGDQSRTKAVIDKAKHILNYNPTTSLEIGVKAQIDWFKENFCK
jgi:nucleoside-diphosphate-sugar epimerase